MSNTENLNDRMKRLRIINIQNETRNPQNELAGTPQANIAPSLPSLDSIVNSSMLNDTKQIMETLMVQNTMLCSY